MRIRKSPEQIKLLEDRRRRRLFPNTARHFK